jgi:ADP-heptose:LPS heptosyltransferase
LKNASPLLEHNPHLDAVYVWGPEAWLVLQAMSFDLVLNIDKSRHACAFLESLRPRERRGYGLNGNGAVVPVNKEAEANYRLGLDDHLKFRVNQKSHSQLLTEAMGLKFRRDEYIFTLTRAEVEFCREYGRTEGISPEVLVVGFNTGCSPVYPNKKMTVDQHVVLIEQVARLGGIRILLLGGPEDRERNAEIARLAGDKVMNTPTGEGLRRGMCYVNLCDIVISGDSFGMHAAIALRKHVIAWFGVSCPQEVDLFDRGVKLIPDGLECSPCWKRECPYNLECIQVIDLQKIVEEVTRYKEARYTEKKI